MRGADLIQPLGRLVRHNAAWLPQAQCRGDRQQMPLFAVQRGCGLLRRIGPGEMREQIADGRLAFRIRARGASSTWSRLRRRWNRHDGRIRESPHVVRARSARRCASYRVWEVGSRVSVAQPGTFPLIDTDPVVAFSVPSNNPSSVDLPVHIKPMTATAFGRWSARWGFPSGGRAVVVDEPPHRQGRK